MRLRREEFKTYERQDKVQEQLQKKNNLRLAAGGVLDMRLGLKCRARAA